MAASSTTASDSVSQSVTSNDSLKRNSNDVGWEYAVLIDPNRLDRVKCILCEKPMFGGIHRMKQHIAGISGNVASCRNATKEDQIKCRNAINEAKRKKMGKLKEDDEIRSGVNIDDMVIDDGARTMSTRESVGSKSQNSSGSMDKFTTQINPKETLNLEKNMREQGIKEAIDKEKLDRVNEYVCKWAYEAGIPFHAFELDSCKRMFAAIGQYGKWCKPPTRYELSESFLKKEVEKTKESLRPHEEEWAKNGCSIMTDAWSDRKRRSIMNLCVNSRLGTVFLSSRDSSDIAHTSEVIHDYVEKCIQEVGEEKVVQIVTDNASNNMAAAKLLKIHRPQIFWTSCAAHSMNLMLEAIANLPRFKKVIDQAKALTIFIYAHHKTLAMMRVHTKKRDIVRPGVTRFASAFLSLQSLSEKRAQLRVMFTSIEWEQCKFSKTAKGKASYTTVLSMGFWNGVSLCLKVLGPLVRVLRIVDGDKKPSMGFVYGELMKAKEEIKVALNNIAKNYQPIIDIVDAKMKDRLTSPVHLTAYLLNPFYHYRDPLIHLDHDVSIGVIDFLDILYPRNIDMQNKIMNEELPIYKNKTGLFGKEVAVVACMENSNNIHTFDPVN